MTGILTPPSHHPGANETKGGLGFKLKTAGAVAAVAALSSGLAFASIPAPDGTITACRNNDNGLLRIVESGRDCHNRETALTWNQTGPQGPAGPAGPAGADGAPGPAGPAGGISGYEVVTETGRDTHPFGGAVELTASCPSGKKAVSGSLSARFVSVGGEEATDFTVVDSGPIPTGNAWYAKAHFPFVIVPHEYRLTLKVVCVEGT